MLLLSFNNIEGKDEFTLFLKHWIPKTPYFSEWFKVLFEKNMIYFDDSKLKLIKIKLNKKLLKGLSPKVNCVSRCYFKNLPLYNIIYYFFSGAELRRVQLTTCWTISLLRTGFHLSVVEKIKICIVSLFLFVGSGGLIKLG